jgi:molecular chaperone GrpE
MNSEAKDKTDDGPPPAATEETSSAGEPGASPAAASPSPAESAAEPRKGHHDHEDAKSLRGKLKKRDHEIKDLKQELETVRAEAAAIKDRYLRAAADMDNQRKRLDRDRTEYLQFAQSELLKELLAVIDNFERALVHPADAVERTGFLAGVELIAKQLQDMVRKRGVTPIAAVGAPFDPTVHQAVLTEEAEDVAEPVIGEELQKGYRLHDRLLRPSLVKVRVPKRPL